MAKNTEELRNVCVSDGTMRTEDLFPKMYWVLKEYAPEKAKEFEKEAADDSWMGGEEDGLIMDELFNALNEIAPEGCVFGSQEGDGACFGFWEVEEESCKRRGRMLKEVSEPNRYYGEGKMIRRNSGENVDAWKKYEHAREVLGAEELLTAFATAMNDQNMLEEIIGYIYQDFAEELSESRRPRGRMLREGRGCSRRRMMKESPVDYAPGADGKPIGNGEYWFKITTPYSGGTSDTNIYKGYLDVTLSDDKVLYQAEMEPKNGDVIVGNNSAIEAYRDEDCKTFACDFHVRSWALKYKKPVGASRDKNRNIVNVYMGRGPKPQKRDRR